MPLLTFQLNNKARAGEFLTKAEVIKKIIAKLEAGGTHTKEDTANSPAITTEMLFGYTNEERQESKWTNSYSGQKLKRRSIF